MRRNRALRALTPLLIVAVAAAGTVTAIRVMRADEVQARAVATPRAAGYERCPRILIPDPSFTRSDSRLPNLGGGLLGRSNEYRDGARSLSLHVGYDALDALEDLDLEQHTETIAGRTVTLHAGGALRAHDPLVAAVWEEPAFSEPCRLLTIITRNVAQEDVRRVIAEIASSAPSGRRS